MKRIIVATLTALMAVGAMAQEFSPIPFRWKWLDADDVIFTYDGTYADTTAFSVNARTGKRTEDVMAPAKYSEFPINPVGAVNLTYSPDQTKLAFTRDNDLYVVDIETEVETRLTFDGPPHVPLSSSPASTQPGWTVVSEPNPTARLRRSFDLPDGWSGREVRLWIGAAQAALAVWCNGTFVGFSQGATDAAEFDLTPHVRNKGNVLALQVFKYAAGTYLEDHDAWRVSGIYRETFLYSVPKSHIADVTLSSDIDAKLISATVDIANPPEGGAVEFSAGGVSESKSAARRVDAELRSGSFPEWNPESPSLVPVRVVLRDGSGKILDIRHFRTALCRSEVKNGVYCINGSPFKFQGVNRHEIDSLRFRAITREMMLRDAELMKKYNFNAVRCSHYTQHPLWYEICDRFGLAVVAEANIESHGLSYHKCV